MPWLTRICLGLMRKPVRSPSWRPRLRTRRPCRASSASPPTSTSPTPWPRSRRPSTPQVRSRSGAARGREMWGIHWLCSQTQLRCLFKRVYASNIIAFSSQVNITLFTKLLRWYFRGWICPAQNLSPKSLQMKGIALSASEQTAAAS